MNITELRSAVDVLRSEIDELSTLDEITPEQDVRLDVAIVELDERTAELAKAEARAAKIEEIRAQSAAGSVIADKGAPNFNKPVDVYDYDLRTLRSNSEVRRRRDEARPRGPPGRRPRGDRAERVLRRPRGEEPGQAERRPRPALPRHDAPRLHARLRQADDRLSRHHRR
jgi:hypothetical protein